MKEYINTVPAEQQMVNSSELSFLGNPNAKKRILIVGNSITRHGPKEDIGWSGDWGMAASAPEKDFVHRFYDMITERGEDAYIRVRQSAHWERNFTKPECLESYVQDRDFGADLLIFRLGENVPKDTVDGFYDAAREFVGYLCPQGKVIFTTCFWAHPVRDAAMHRLAKEMGAPCVEITCTDDSMMALGLFEHHGVSIHPGDSGMEMIAQRLCKAYYAQSLFEGEIQNEDSRCNI